ncbi:MAG: right-handed parallel beta-helix repeat-containing protein [Acidimicrobiia bacterium]|nr:right-handed parallel beta-helix repeat-containing protein [Acidimicrobiia bacterium]
MARWHRHSRTRIALLTVLAVLPFALSPSSGADDATYRGSTAGWPLNRGIVGLDASPSGGGYWLAAADGGVFAFGDARFHGSMGGTPLNQPVVGIASTPGGGYWLAAADGGVFAFGDARFQGSLAGTALDHPIVDIAATPTGGGYWLVAADGGVFAFGDARFHGSAFGSVSARVVSITATPSGGGYWLATEDGGVFAFGDAPFLGSAAGAAGARVVSIAETPSGGGYWLAAEDGGVFAFGDAPFFGSLSGVLLQQPVVGLATPPTGSGYWLVAGDGGIFASDELGPRSWPAAQASGPTESPLDAGPSNPSLLQPSGPLTISTPGAVIENVDVNGAITVHAPNVTIRNFRASNIVQEGAGGMVLEDGEVHGFNDPGFGGDGIVWADFTARRVDVHHVHDGFKAHGDVLIESTWVHDLNARRGPGAGAGGYSHNDCVQVSSGSNIVLRNSRFERCGLNAAVFIDADQGPIDNVLVENNFIDGGGFTLYSIRSRSAPWFGVPTNVVIRNNTFGNDHLFDYATISGNVVWEGNVDTAGRPISAQLDGLS